jgi:hypothetical protein
MATAKWQRSQCEHVPPGRLVLAVPEEVSAVLSEVMFEWQGIGAASPAAATLRATGIVAAMAPARGSQTIINTMSSFRAKNMLSGHQAEEEVRGGRHQGRVRSNSARKTRRDPAERARRGLGQICVCLKHF